MKKVKEIYYIDNREKRASDFSTGFVFILEDGSKVKTMTTSVVKDVIDVAQGNEPENTKDQVETMTTDTIAERYTIDPNHFNLGHLTGKSASTKGEQYKCPSYVEDGKVINCNCGKCF